MGRRFGQHFLSDRGILEKIADKAAILPDETIVEIGPGRGSLTSVLVERAARVIAIEIDRGLYPGLKDKFAGSSNLELHLADALRFDYSVIERFKVVSNIPYEITTPLIFKLLEHKERIVSMTITMQKEVADRILARVGTKEYGVLTITAGLYTRPRHLFDIPKEVFKPSPKVDSSVIYFEVTERPTVDISDEGAYFRIVRAAFAQRRKTISNSLKSVFGDKTKSILYSAGISLDLRPERLSKDDFARILEGSKL